MMIQNGLVAVCIGLVLFASLVCVGAVVISALEAVGVIAKRGI